MHLHVRAVAQPWSAQDMRQPQAVYAACTCWDLQNACRTSGCKQGGELAFVVRGVPGVGGLLAQDAAYMLNGRGLIAYIV